MFYQTSVLLLLLHCATCYTDSSSSSSNHGNHQRVRRDLGMLRMGKRLPGYYDVDSLVDGDDVSFESEGFGQGHGFGWLKLQQDYGSWPYVRRSGKRSSAVSSSDDDASDEDDFRSESERLAFYDRLHDLLVAYHQTLGRKKREVAAADAEPALASPGDADAGSNKTAAAAAAGSKTRPSPSTTSTSSQLLRNKQQQQQQQQNAQLGEDRKLLRSKRSLHPRLGFYRAPYPSPARSSVSRGGHYNRAPLPRLGVRDDDKRSMAMLRMGKRLGERSMSMMRMGRSGTNNMDTDMEEDKRSMSMLRMGRSMSRDDQVDVDVGKRSMSMLRMGRSSSSSSRSGFQGDDDVIDDNDKRSMSMLRMG